MKMKIFYLIPVMLFLLINTEPALSQKKGIVFPTEFKTASVNGVELFYREAGSKSAPVLILLHGYPTSSFMYRNLIRELSDEYHLIAPDYPGYGNSEQPDMQNFDFTFDNMSVIIEDFINQLGIQNFSLYVMDYGAPIGFRIAERNPERIQTLIIQNGNAYEEGLEEFWNPFRKFWQTKSEEKETLESFHSLEGLKWQYTHGVNQKQLVSPDNWQMDLRHLSREGNNEIQLAMFYDYQFNLIEYPRWQEYFRMYQPATLILWGKNDHIFPPSGAEAYKKDIKHIDSHMYDTGHFPLETHLTEMTDTIRKFLKKNL